MADAKKDNGNTVLGANLVLDRKAISEESHKAVLDCEMTLARAKDLGPGHGPDGPVAEPKAAKKAKAKEPGSPCLCGCGVMVARRFAPGHDARMFRVAREHLAEGRELSGEQTEYLEASGKMGRVGARLAEDERRRERAAKKAGR